MLGKRTGIWYPIQPECVFYMSSEASCCIMWDEGAGKCEGRWEAGVHHSAL